MMRQFAIGVAWISAAAWGEQILNLIIFVLIARIIGTEQFGLAGMALAFIFMAETLIRSTLGESIIERKEMKEGFLESTFALIMAAGLGLTVLLLAIAPVSGELLYRETTVTWLIIAAAPIILLLAVSEVPTALLRRRLAFHIIALRTLAGVVAGGAAGIYLAINGFGAWALIGQRLVMTLVNCVIAVVAAGWIPKMMPKREHLPLIGGLGPRVVVIRGAGIITQQAPAIALGMFSGAQAVAVYALALRLVESLATLIVAPIRGVAQSVIAEMRRAGSESGKFISELAQIVALVGFAMLGGLAVVGDPVIEVIFGPGWSEAFMVLPWVCLAGGLQALNDLNESYLFALDRTERWVRLIIVETIIGTILIVLASPYGPALTAAAYALRITVFFPFRAAIVVDVEKIPLGQYFKSVIIVPALLTAAMLVSVFWWRAFALEQMHDLTYLILAILIGAGAFFIALRFGTPNVMTRALQFVKSIRSKDSEFSRP